MSARPLAPGRRRPGPAFRPTRRLGWLVLAAGLLPWLDPGLFGPVLGLAALAFLVDLALAPDPARVRVRIDLPERATVGETVALALAAEPWPRFGGAAGLATTPGIGPAPRLRRPGQVALPVRAPGAAAVGPVLLEAYGPLGLAARRALHDVTAELLAVWPLPAPGAMPAPWLPGEGGSTVVVLSAPPGGGPSRAAVDAAGRLLAEADRQAVAARHLVVGVDAAPTAPPVGGAASSFLAAAARVAPCDDAAPAVAAAAVLAEATEAMRVVWFGPVLLLLHRPAYVEACLRLARRHPLVLVDAQDRPADGARALAGAVVRASSAASVSAAIGRLRRAGVEVGHLEGGRWQRLDPPVPALPAEPPSHRLAAGRALVQGKGGEAADVLAAVNLAWALAADRDELRALRNEDGAREVEGVLAALLPRLYGARRVGRGRLVRFAAAGFPRLLRCHLPAFLTAAATFAAGGAVSAAVSLATPHAAAAFLPPGVRPLAGGRAFPPALDPIVAASVFTNNLFVSLLAFGLGVGAALPTLTILFRNGLLMGALWALYHAHGLDLRFWSLIVPHGVVELTAVFLAGAAGLELGWAVLQPGHRSRVANLRERAEVALRLFAPVPALLSAAAVVEGFVTPSGLPATVKLALGGVFALVLGAYLAGGGRGR